MHKYYGLRTEYYTQKRSWTYSANECEDDMMPPRVTMKSFDRMITIQWYENEEERESVIESIAKAGGKRTVPWRLK